LPAMLPTKFDLTQRGRTPDWLKVKNPKAPAVTREAEEDWSGRWSSVGSRIQPSPLGAFLEKIGLQGSMNPAGSRTGLRETRQSIKPPVASQKRRCKRGVPLQIKIAPSTKRDDDG
jgi:hypothetical protein